MQTEIQTRLCYPVSMSNKIQLDTSRVAKTTPVHVLPCHIAYDGPSKVSQCFKPRIDPVDQTILTGSFRGRKLRGRTIPLPKNYSGIKLVQNAYTGHVFHPVEPSARFDRRRFGDEDDDDEEDEIEKTKWESGEAFDSFTVWDHQVLPDNKQDHWIRGIEEWIAMADIVLPLSR